MAKSSDSADSWPGFLAELSKNFLILRDVFGYALPGAVFLSIGVLCRRFSLHDVKYYLLDPYQLPAWMAVLVGLGVCYAIGHVMAGIAYLPYNAYKLPFRKAAAAKSSARVPAELIDFRARHPEILIEFERQGTMTQLRGSTGVAMLVGSLVFFWFPTPSLGWMLGLAGAFLLLMFWLSAMPHMDELRTSTIAGGKLTDNADQAVVDPAAAQQGLIAAATEVLKKL